MLGKKLTCATRSVCVSKVAYQKTLQLSYVDKFLSDIQMEFRNKYKDDLQKQNLYQNFDFGEMFHRRLKLTEEAFNEEAKAPR